MSDWKVTIPSATRNVVLNPSFETGTTNWVTGGSNTIARDATEQFLGVYSCKATYQDNALLASYGVTLTAAEYTFSIMLWIPTAYDGGGVSIQFANFAGITGGGPQAADMAKRDQWQLVEIAGTPAGGDLAGDLQIINTGAAPTAGRLLYADSAQCELGDGATTRCDGSQPGCEWLGIPHASISQRSALSRAGGFERDLREYLFFGVDTFQGFGTSGQRVNVDEFVLIPGGTLNSIKVRPRTEARLVGNIRDFGEPATCNLLDMRQTLTRALSPRSYPDADGKPQPVRLRYDGATVPKVISVHLADGLEGNITTEAKVSNVEPATLHFISPRPFLLGLDDSGAALNTNSTMSVRYVAGRLRSTGQWDNLGAVSGPSSSGALPILAAIRHPNGKTYYAGEFVGWEGNTGWDHIVAYDHASGAWEIVGSPGDFKDTIRALAIGPDETLYAGGSFTNAAGDSNADYLAQFDGTSWSAVGQPVQGAASITQVNALATEGAYLYAGGIFENWADIANADGIVQWNGTVYSALGSPGVVTINAIAADDQGNVYVGGPFQNLASIPEADYIAMWDGSSWTDVGGGLTAAVNALLWRDSLLYLGGLFPNIGGNPNASHIATWNGLAYAALGTGLNDNCFTIAASPTGIIYAGGDFDEAGGINLADRIAGWNGSSWFHLGLDLPSIPAVYAIAIGPSDPVIPSNYDLLLGFNISGAAYSAGSTLIDVVGTAPSYPTISIRRTGGTKAVIQTIRNEVTGKELLFNYRLADGETITIFTEPSGVGQAIISDPYGLQMQATLPNSDLGQFALQPGIQNQITAFVNVSDLPTIEATIQWRAAYEGLD